jgi:6-phosphogluconate dehydrogenase
VKEIIKEIKNKMNTFELGVFGLGVMGKSLARNFASRKIPVNTYNHVLNKAEENVGLDFSKQFGSDFLGNSIVIGDFIQSLKKPRLILLMISAGKPIDDTIELLLPLLDKGDMIIDAGNSYFKDTERRNIHIVDKGLNFVGMGVSGGEEGALIGPAIMPAGNDLAKDRLLPLLQKISAVADNMPCVKWLGHGGAGHFIKMIHNGIEYADMQIISEAYALLKDNGWDNFAIADEMSSWNEHKSYLIDITTQILKYKENDTFLLDEILDVAGHKGTGSWTSMCSFELGVAAPTIVAAMNQRILSTHKNIRLNLGSEISSNEAINPVLIRRAAFFARMVALAEGIHMIKAAANLYGWRYNIKDILQIWRGGCIIRSDMLLNFLDIENIEICNNLFECNDFIFLLDQNKDAVAELISIQSQNRMPLPCIHAAFEHYRTMYSSFLPINLIQAQRDFFGAHTFKKVFSGDRTYHSSWK